MDLLCCVGARARRPPSTSSALKNAADVITIARSEGVQLVKSPGCPEKMFDLQEISAG